MAGGKTSINALGQAFDLLRGLVEDRRDLVHHFFVRILAGDAVPERREQAGDRALDRRAAGLAIVAAELLQADEQGVDLLRMLLEMRLAVAGGGEGLARAFALRLLDQPHVLEHRESRVDDPRAGRIGAVADLLDRANQVVAVARLIGDQLKQQQPKFVAREHPAATAPAAAAAVAPVAAPVPALAPAAAALAEIDRE